MDDRRLQTRETDLRTTRHPLRQLHASRHVSDRIHDRHRLQDGLSRARIGSLELQQLLNLSDRHEHMRVINSNRLVRGVLRVYVSGWNDVLELPSLVEVGLRRAVEAEYREPSASGHCGDPVLNVR